MRAVARSGACTLQRSPGLWGEGTEPLAQSFQRDCFYEGSIEGFSISLVALSACAGLR